MDEGIQVHHQLASAQYDIDSAFALVEEFRFGYSMSLCGACLEKLFNALWIRSFGDYPPYGVPLLYLAKKLDLPLKEKQVKLLAAFSLFEVHPEDAGRWKALRRAIDKKYVEKHLVKAEEFIEWVKPRLKK